MYIHRGYLFTTTVSIPFDALLARNTFAHNLRSHPPVITYIRYITPRWKSVMSQYVGTCRADNFIATDYFRSGFAGVDDDAVTRRVRIVLIVVYSHQLG